MNARDALTGALIALSDTAGRATKFVSDETDDIVIGGTAASAGNAADATLLAFAERAHEENARLAKESESAAIADFDMGSLAGNDNERGLKLMILDGLRDAAGPTLLARNQELSNPEVNAFFRAGLFTIGNPESTLVQLLELSNSVGEVNWFVLEALGTKSGADDPASKIASALAAGLQSKTISRVFFVGGACQDDAAFGYYETLAKAAPADSIFVAFGEIAKRLESLDLGKIDDRERVINLGGKEALYTAVQISVALASKLNASVNDLPLSYLISRDDCEGVAAALTLVWIGIKNVSLGPVPAEYLTDSIVNLFKQIYGLKFATEAESDLAEFLQ